MSWLAWRDGSGLSCGDGETIIYLRRSILTGLSANINISACCLHVRLPRVGEKDRVWWGWKKSMSHCRCLQQGKVDMGLRRLMRIRLPGESSPGGMRC